MRNEWQEGVWLGLSLILAAMQLIFCVYLGNSERTVAQHQQEEYLAIEILKEYRTYNQYDNVELYPQDVVALILEQKGDIAVQVQPTPTSSTYTWDSSIPQHVKAWSADYISSILDLNRTYVSTIQTDANGAIVKFNVRCK